MSDDNIEPPEQDSVQILLDIKSGKVPASAAPQDLRGKSLANMDLSDMDLPGVDFSGADLTGTNLSNSRLFRSKFVKTNLLNANLNNCELSGANLSGANMERVSAVGAGFGMACLNSVNMFEGNLDDATLTMSTLENADLRCVTMKNSRVREAKLLGTDFTEADMKGVDLAKCQVQGAIFRNADMRETRLRAIEGFEKASWIGVDIRDVNFMGAYRLRRFVVDQNYLKEFRDTSRFNEIIYHFWYITSDCGRSIYRWGFWIMLQVFVFAYLYMLAGIDCGRYPTWLSSIYFSMITLTTLGYGDVVPATLEAQILSMLEVMIGYGMLGGLLSILSNKMARRGD